MKIIIRKINLKKIFSIHAVVFTIFLVGGCELMKKQQDFFFHRVLVIASNQLNKDLPKMLDEETRMDLTEVKPGKEFIYYLTIINLTADEIDLKIFDEIKQNILNDVKINPDVSIFRDNDVTIIYIYRDKLMNEIIQIRVKPEDYK